MLKKLFSNDARVSKKYQRQFSAGDSEQRLQVLRDISDAIAASKLSDIGPELKQLFSSSVATESNAQVKIALIPWIDDEDIGNAVGRRCGGASCRAPIGAADAR